MDVSSVSDHMVSKFVSLAEGIDATTPAGKLQLHILGAIAEFERGRIQERVMAGLQRARAQGKQLQPPSPPQLDPNMRSALEELQRHLGTRIILRLKTKVRPGQLVLEFYDDAQLMGLYDRLMK